MVRDVVFTVTDTVDAHLADLIADAVLLPAAPAAVVDVLVSALVDVTTDGPVVAVASGPLPPDAHPAPSRPAVAAVAAITTIRCRRDPAHLQATPICCSAPVPDGHIAHYPNLQRTSAW